MSKQFLKFGDVDCEKRNFHSSKSPIDVGNSNIEKIVRSGKFLCTKKDSKYFVGYKNNEVLVHTKRGGGYPN